MTAIYLCILLGMCQDGLAKAEQNDSGWRNWRVEYELFLDASWDEAEEPCEVSEESNNPLLGNWFSRHCL